MNRKHRSDLGSTGDGFEEAPTGAMRALAERFRGLLRKSVRERPEQAVWDRAQQNAGLG